MSKNLMIPDPAADDWQHAIHVARELIRRKSNSLSQTKDEILLYVKECLEGLESSIVSTLEAGSYLIARAGSRSPAFSLIFSGHLDTVGESQMQDPFFPKIHNGYLSGRGSVDMKGGCAAMMQAFRAFAEIPNPRGEVRLVLTLDEEIGSFNMIHALKTRVKKADLAIIAEPSNLRLMVAHRGSQWITVTFHGKACHSGTPNNSRNAVIMATQFIQAMQDYKQKHFQHRYHRICGEPTLNVGMIRGGNGFPNVVPDVCEIRIDRRWNPNEIIDLICKDMEAILDACRSHDPEFQATLEYEGLDQGAVYPPLDFSQQTELLNILNKAIAKAGLEPPPQEFFSGWTEGALLEKKGIPSVIFGPGDMAMAHTIEERIETVQIVNAAKAYFAIMMQCCGP